MKNYWKVLILVFVGITISGCASVPSVPPETDNSIIEVKLNEGINTDESVLVIQRINSAIGVLIPMAVWLDGKEVASGIGSGKEIQLSIPNGEHKIQAGSTAIDKGNLITFTIEGEVIVFSAEPRMGILAARFNLKQLGKKKI